jgi:hypothetical protein
VKRFALALVTAAAATLTAGSLQAQTCNTNGTATAASNTTICSVSVAASATVHDVMRLTLGSITQDLGTPTETDYTAGYRDANGTTATVKSNRPWKVTVVAATPSFAYDAQGSGLSRTKPSSDLLWGTASGTYGNNMGSSADLFSGTAGTSSSAQAIFFRTNWSWTNDVPGKYDITLNFTLSTP